MRESRPRGEDCDPIPWSSKGARALTRRCLHSELALDFAVGVEGEELRGNEKVSMISMWTALEACVRGLHLLWPGLPSV